MQRPNVCPNEVISGGFGIGQPWLRDYIRVVSWNIERGLQFSAILAFLRDVEADLILLQEVDLNARRTKYRDVARELAQSLRLNYGFGKQFQELGGGSGITPAHHGLATLSPWPLSSARVIRFRQQSDFWKPRWYIPQVELFQRRRGGRIALVTEALIYHQRILSYNLHLESRGNNLLRLQQLRETLDDAGPLTRSSLVIVGGDFNLDAGSGEAARMLDKAGFHDAIRLPEIPTTAPRRLFQQARSIDWIYVSDGGGCKGQVHHTVYASDHYPVLCDLCLADVTQRRITCDALPIISR